MNNLLSAGFARLCKNRLFWTGLLVLPGFTAFNLFMFYREMKLFQGMLGEFQYSLDDYLYAPSLLIGIFTAVFAALFLGTEYRDGILRNKLTAGHSRAAVYLSSLAICFAASLLVYLACIIVTFALGIPMFGMPETPPLTILQKHACSVLMIAALSGLFTLLVMTIASKSASAAVCTLCIFALLFLTFYILQRLMAPELLSGYELGAGEELVYMTTPNPSYLDGGKRKLFEFLRDLLPTGIGIELWHFGLLENPPQACLCSLFVTAATTAGGILAFRKKDLK